MIAPTISTKTFASRRVALMEAMPNNSLAIIPAADLKVRSNDTEYPFRQDSDFWYLTGFPEPGAIALLVPGQETPFVLFSSVRDPSRERWTGKIIGQQRAKDDFGADAAFALDEFEQELEKLLANVQSVVVALGSNEVLDEMLFRITAKLHKKERQGISAPTQFVDIRPLLSEARLIKSAEEVEMIRYAGSVASEGHRRAMRAVAPNLMEWELHAELLHEFTRHGMKEAYTSIVGAGENSCILHYIENNQPVKAGDLVLIDAGAEHQGYASDITRTFPVTGQFSEEQKLLYELVLKAQLAAIEEIKPGAVWESFHQKAAEVLVDGLIELGLITPDREAQLADTPPEDDQFVHYRRFYMHGTGHWLGLDVHDVGVTKIDGQGRELRPGMVLTVEPGLYISPEEPVDERWWGIGIRIEDDVLVTETGHEVLTAGMEKTIADIEALMASR